MEATGKVMIMVMLSSLVVSAFAGELACAGDNNALELYDNSGHTWVAGSTIMITYVYDGSNEITMPVGKQVMHYSLIDAEGKKVFEWKQKPEQWWYDHKVGNIVYGIHTRDHFDCKIPVMWGREGGEWRIEARLRDEAGDILVDASINYNFDVEKGSFFDNFRAPIYIYGEQKIAGIKIGHVAWELPAPILITSPAWFLLTAFGFIFVAKRMAKSGWQQLEASKLYLKKEMKK